VKRVLFVCYGGGHVNMVIPILQRMAARNDIHCDVLGLTTAAQILRDYGFSPMGFADFITDEDRRAREMGERLVSENATGTVSREESIAYLGLSYYDLELRFGSDVAADIYANKGRQGFLPVTVLERILDRLQPDLVVATNSPRAEQAAIIAAANRGVPAICMIDLFALQEIKWIGQPGYANRVCTLDSRTAQSLLGAGRLPHEVVVTGNPAFDRLTHPGLEQEAAELRKVRQWGGNWVILWASQPEPKNHPFTGAPGDTMLPEKILQALRVVLDRHHDWHLVIRPHPSEGNYKGRLGPREEASPGTESLPLILKSVDVVVTMTSTVGLEAVLLNKPLVTVDLSVFTPDMPYSERGFSHGVSKLDDLEAALLDVQQGRWQPAVEMGKAGKATQHVIEVIDELLAV
jgi:hypothetical protein